MLATGGKDHTVRLWDVENAKFLKTLTGHARPIYSVSFSPDGKTLASGSSDGTLLLWDMSDYTKTPHEE